MSNVLGEKLFYADYIAASGHTWTSLWKSETIYKQDMN